MPNLAEPLIRGRRRPPRARGRHAHGGRHLRGPRQLLHQEDPAHVRGGAEYSRRAKLDRSAARSSVAADPRDPRRAKLERLASCRAPRPIPAIRAARSSNVSASRRAPRADPRARRHPIVFHLCAVCGLFAFALCFIAIAATYYGDAKVKKVVCAIYGAWLLCIFAVQYTHPWTGSAPESIFQMPAPIVYMMVLVVGTGVALDDDVKLKLK